MKSSKWIRGREREKAQRRESVNCTTSISRVWGKRSFTCKFKAVGSTTMRLRALPHLPTSQYTCHTEHTQTHINTMNNDIHVHR